MKVTIRTTSAETMMIDRTCSGTLLACLIVLSATFSAHAQQNDFRVWPSVGAGLEVFKDVKLLLEEEFRFRENCRLPEKQINDLGAQVRISKYLRASLFYRVEANWKNADDRVWRQGVYADLIFRYRTGRFQSAYRTRFQSAQVEFSQKDDRMLSALVNRHKVKVDYNIRKLPLAPFAEGELFYGLAGHRYSLTDYRAWIGLDYTPGKIHEFSIKYGFNRERGVPDPLTSYIIAVNYTVNLRL